jgi:hypothetical protein
MTYFRAVHAGRLVMLVAALAMLALPAMASAQGPVQEIDTEGNKNCVAPGGEGGEGGSASVGGGPGDDTADASGGNGGAGGCNTTSNVTNPSERVVVREHVGGGGQAVGGGVQDQAVQGQAVGGGVQDQAVGGVGGGVPLAQTGFDAWIVALLGGLCLTGGLTALAAQRRGGLRGLIRR